MFESGEQIDKLRDYLKKSKAKNHPIRGHLSENASDYAKNHYFKMLCLVLRCDATTEQTALLRRLIQGCGAEGSAQEYMRRALDMGEEDFTEFMERAVTGELRYAFILDALVLSHLEPCGEDCDRLIAELSEGMGIQSAELASLARLCRCILMRNAALFEKIEDAELQCIPTRAYLPYFDFYDKGLVLNANGNTHHWAREDRERRSLPNFERDVKSRTVVYENLKIVLHEETIDFRGCETVRFVNCEIAGNGGVVFDGVETAIFERCALSDSMYVAICGSSLNLSILRSDFVNCGQKASPGFNCNGGVISLSGRTDSIVIENCSFRNCYLMGDEGWTHRLSGVILDANSKKLTLKNNKFTACKIRDHHHDTIPALISGDFEQITAENNIRSGELTRLFRNEEYERNYGNK